MIDARTPAVAGEVYHSLALGTVPENGCVSAVLEATAFLDRQGFAARPSWQDVANGVRTPKFVVAEASEWQHGWQYFASSTSEYHFLTANLRPTR